MKQEITYIQKKIEQLEKDKAYFQKIAVHQNMSSIINKAEREIKILNNILTKIKN